jgi:hyperosmotically inducible protein
VFSRRVLLACLAAAALPACGISTRTPSTDAAMEDATITARVKTALLNDQTIGATKIDVTTADGVVTLSGTVKSRADEARAIELARQTPGVKDVKSTLQAGS